MEYLQGGTLNLKSPLSSLVASSEWPTQAETQILYLTLKPKIDH